MPADVKWHPVLVRAIVSILKQTFVEGFYADKVIERTFKQNKKWGSRDRRFIAETVYDMVRWWGFLSVVAEIPKLDDSEITQNQALNDSQIVLCWVFYERHKSKRDATAFVRQNFPEIKIPNIEAVDSRLKSAELAPWEKVSFPHWLFEIISREYSHEADKIFTTLNEMAPVFLRANTLKTNREDLIKALSDENVKGAEVSEGADAVVLLERQNVFITQAFKSGLFEVQDLASQQVVPLLAPKPGERIADVCAGAGGKTLHIAAAMKNKGTLLASDISPRKLEELKIRARRAGISNLRTVELLDSKNLKRQAGLFDGVLIDAPCSGTGVIRRNADTKWKLKEGDLEALLKTQSEILDVYSKLVKPGGRLLYVTCSILREENQNQVKAFIERHPEFDLDGPEFSTLPASGGGDGFFAQRFIKKN